MPIFDATAKAHPYDKDSVYFLMDDLSDELKQQIVLYGSALSQEGSASSDEKPRYKQLRDKYYREARTLFNTEFLSKTIVEYMGERHPLQGMQGAQNESKIDSVNAVTSYIMESQFEAENPHYPKFTALPQPLTKDNRDNMLRSARAKIAKPTDMNRNAEAILMGLGLWENGHLSTEHSEYARSIKTKLEAKGGQVLNRDEILEVFYAETNEYISSDFHIEADLEMLVLATMAALGEIEIVLQGGNRINAGNIADITKISPQDNYNFSNVCPPKGINIPLIREIMLGLLGVDRTNELDNPNTSVFADLLSKAQALESKIAVLQYKIHGGYRFAGDIEIISEEDARNLDNELVRLKGICAKLPRYNTKAKMRNIDWPMDVVKTAMTETRRKVSETNELLTELDGLKNVISYLRTALSNINDISLRDDINAAIDELKDVITKNKTAREAYKSRLEALKEKYADWYMNEYLKAHISEIDYGRKQAIMSQSNKMICDIVRNAPFINPSRYDNWQRKMNLLQVVNPNVNKNAILSMPTSVDGFNPTLNHEALPSLSELHNELNEIFVEFEQNFHEALEDPTTFKNRDLLNEQEKVIIEQFKNGKIGLNQQYAHILIEIINKLQRSFTKIEIGHDEMIKIFSRPMTKQQALDALASYIDNQSRGHKPEDVRIIIK